jgi:hypothetical protein
VTSLLLRPTCACAQHVRRAWVCAGAILLLAAPAFGDTIGAAGYSSWQWHGVSWSPSSGGWAAESTAASNTASPAIMSAAVSEFNAASSASTAGGDVGGSYGYSSWQWHGISRSGSSASAGYSAASTSSSAYSNTANPYVGDGGTASLSGYVYVDTNSNQTMDTADWAIANATITLTDVGSSTPFASVLSSQNGSYSFTGLAAGTYTLAMTTATNHPGQDSGSAHAILDSSGQLVSLTDTVEQNAYANIAMGDGDTGTNFNFAELTYPGVLISKAMFLSNSPPVQHTDDVVPATPTNPVPEPNALVLLAVVGLFLAGIGWRRSRKCKT